jgi:hypothetical protein
VCVTLCTCAFVVISSVQYVYFLILHSFLYLTLFGKRVTYIGSFHDGLHTTACSNDNSSPNNVRLSYFQLEYALDPKKKERTTCTRTGITHQALSTSKYVVREMTDTS